MNAFMPKYSKLMFFSTRAEDVAQLFTAAELFFSGTKTPQHHRLGSRVDWPNWDRIKSLCWFQPNRALHFDSFTIRQDLINQKSVPHSRHTQSGPIILFFFFWGSHDLFASLQTERCAWTWNYFRCGLLATHQAISHRYTATDVREKLERVAKSHKVERFWAFFCCIEPWIRQTGNHVILLSDLMSMCVRALALLQSVRSAQTPKMAPIDPCASTHAEAVQFGEGAACTFYLLSRMWIQIHAAQYTEMLSRFFFFF